MTAFSEKSRGDLGLSTSLFNFIKEAYAATPVWAKAHRMRMYVDPPQFATIRLPHPSAVLTLFVNPPGRDMEIMEIIELEYQSYFGIDGSAGVHCHN